MYETLNTGGASSKCTWKISPVRSNWLQPQVSAKPEDVCRKGVIVRSTKPEILNALILDRGRRGPETQQKRETENPS